MAIAGTGFWLILLPSAVIKILFKVLRNFLEISKAGGYDLPTSYSIILEMKSMNNY